MFKKHLNSLFALLFLTTFNLAAQVTGDTAKLSNYSLGVKAYTEGEFRRAFDAWIMGAYEGDAESQYNLGVLYLEGHGVERSIEQARSWFMKAAEKNRVEAQYNLGHMSLSGMGVEKNVQAALLWWKLAAEGGYAQAQFNYGRALYLGVEGYNDKDRGLELISLAAEQKDRRAIEFLSNNADEIAVLTATKAKQVAIAVKPTATEAELKVAKIVPTAPKKVARVDEPLVEEDTVSKVLPASEPGKIKLRIVRDQQPVQQNYLIRSAEIPATIYATADLRVPMGNIAPGTLLKVTGIKENKIRVLPAVGLPAVWAKREDLILQAIYPSVKEDDTRVFARPGEKNIGVLPAGTRFDVLEQNGNWVNLRVFTPGYGWIAASNLKYSGENSQQLREAWQAESLAVKDTEVKASKPEKMLIAGAKVKEEVLPEQAEGAKETAATENSQISGADGAIQDQSKSLTNNNEWLFSQKKGTHVIHLFTSLDFDKSLRISKQVRYRDQAQLYTTLVNQKQSTFLLLGPYADQATANAARGALPARYAKHALVRSLALIAKNRCAKRNSLDAQQAIGLDAFCGGDAASNLKYSGENSQQLREARQAESLAVKDSEVKASKPEKMLIAGARAKEEVLPEQAEGVKETAATENSQISGADGALQNQSKSLINNNEWLFTQEKGTHVIHLFTLLDFDKALRISKQARYRDQAQLYTTLVNQKQLTFLLLGPYADKAGANAARGALPARIAKHALVRPLALIAKNRCAKRNLLDAQQAKGLDAFCF
ncbi:MAG: SH3 domain-containing protein [Proteobacteria bacterium]|nr:SH3 domain-containing protein [Pseudomonadota bacterium]